MIRSKPRYTFNLERNVWFYSVKPIKAIRDSLLLILWFSTNVVKNNLNAFPFHSKDFNHILLHRITKVTVLRVILFPRRNFYTDTWNVNCTSKILLFFNDAVISALKFSSSSIGFCQNRTTANRCKIVESHFANLAN